jgi:Flp pilus assembly pilin Flp
MFERLNVLFGRAYCRLQDIKREEGQTTVEYAIIVALVIVMAIAAFAVLQTQVTSFMSKIGSKISAVIP